MAADEHAAAVERAEKHHGHLASFPPYVGGDDDEIEAWIPQCACGWTGDRVHSVTRAHMELIAHLNESLFALAAALTETQKERERLRLWFGMPGPNPSEGYFDV